jgi:hypothetical protein
MSSGLFGLQQQCLRLNGDAIFLSETNRPSVLYFKYKRIKMQNVKIHSDIVTYLRHIFSGYQGTQRNENRIEIMSHCKIFLNHIYVVKLFQ